jgi:2-phosphosulfolactate phosphatase
MSPALYPLYHCAEAMVVVVDVYRATTTITAAFESGARRIRPVATIEEAQSYKAEGFLVGAERNVRRCDFADFGNSPFDYTPEKVNGKELVFTTTNGTKAIRYAENAYCILIGAFINLQAVADYCVREKRDVVVLCSGWEDKINMEDTLFGGALADILQAHGYQPAGDAAKMALSLWQKARTDLRGMIEQSEHIKRLKANNLEKDAAYCLLLNQSKLVPVFSKTENKLVIP